MIAHRPLPGYLAALFAAGAVTFASARAQASCTTDAECGKGLACKAVATEACVSMACPAGSECPPSPPCNPTEIKECVPGPCSVDADCGDGLVCFETTTEKLCVPRYLLPCTTASDCGTGFNCVLDTPGCDCAISGGGTDPAPAPTPMPAPPSTGAPAPSGSGAPPMMGAGGGTSLPPECTCPPATTNHCVPQVVDCMATSDCPTGWLCTVVSTSSGGSACGAPIYPDGGVGPTVCEPPPPPVEIRECTPPYYDAVQHASDSGGSLSGGSLGLPMGSSENGAAGSGNTATGAPKSSSAPGAAASGDQGGCQIGQGRSGAGASLLALVGLIGLARRKRATRRQ